MGFRISYLATTAAPDAVASAFGIEFERKDREAPERRDWIGVLKSSGWTLFWSENEEFFAGNPKAVATLSNNAPVYVCRVNETVMYCSSEFWRSGDLDWKVEHDADQDLEHLEVRGTPPGFKAERDARLAELRADPDPCDYIFEVPLNLAAQVIKFRHEDALGQDEVDEFRVIQKPSLPSFLGRLFGRR
ncbi:MAG: hypothetical protein AAFN27_18765 [Pseudomonadota bacterium]